MNIQNWNEERLDNMIQDLEEWMCLVAYEEDCLVKEDDDIVSIFGSKANYLEELVDWVYEHVCSEDRNNPNFWMSHGFTEEEVSELCGDSYEMNFER